MILSAQVQELELGRPEAEWTEVHDVWRTEVNPIRLLAFTPAHPDYGIKPQTVDSIQAAIRTHGGSIDWMISSGDNPFDSHFENVAYQHNKARAMVLDGLYDGLLSIEADMIIPPDTIGQLLSTNADVAYGLYVWRHQLKRWSAYKSLSLWGGESVSLDYSGADAREVWGKVIDVAGLGMGCTLIRREVLKRFPFRLHDGRHSWIVDEYADDFKTLGISPYRDHKNMVCDDWLFAMDAKHYGFTQRANLNVVCGHIDGDSILWPDPQEKQLCRIECIKES